MKALSVVSVILCTLFYITSAKQYELGHYDPSVGCASELPDIPKVQGEFKLSQVQVFVRHGDRTPTHDLVTDDRWSNACSVKPCPPGYLTSLGEEEAYSLGAYLRKKYVHELSFLEGNEKDLKRITAYRSESQRTEDTLRHVFYGLLPVITTNETKHTVEYKMLRPLMPNLHDCPNILALYETARKKWPEEMYRMEEELPERVASGLHDNHHPTPKWFFNEEDHFTSTIFFAPTVEYANRAYRCHGLERPVGAELEREVSDAANFAFVDTYCKNGDVWQPAIAVLYEKLLHSIDEDHSKVIFYGTHDSTICALLAGLSPRDAVWPPYTATLLFEIYEHPRGRYARVVFNDHVLLSNSSACGRRADGLCPVAVLKGMMEKVVAKKGMCQGGNAAPTTVV